MKFPIALTNLSMKPTQMSARLNTKCGIPYSMGSNLTIDELKKTGFTNYRITYSMRNDSCRKCGCELEVNKKCNICREPNEFFCHRCGDVTVEQIHSQCMLINFSYRLLEVPLQKIK